MGCSSSDQGAVDKSVSPTLVVTEQATPTPQPTLVSAATSTPEPTTAPIPTSEPTATPAPEPTATPAPEPTATPALEPTATTVSDSTGLIAFSSESFYVGETGNFRISVMKPDGSGQREIIDLHGDNARPKWSPDGLQITFSQTQWLSDPFFQVWSVEPDGANLEKLEEFPEWSLFAFSPDDTQFAFISEFPWNMTFETEFDNQIYVMEVVGEVANLTQLTDFDSSISTILGDWSPDGSKIVFSHGDSNSSEIYVMDVDGSNQTRLTSNEFEDGSPSWSTDGTRIVYHSNRDGNFEIYVMDSDGLNQTRITFNTYDDKSPDWGTEAP